MGFALLLSFILFESVSQAMNQAHRDQSPVYPENSMIHMLLEVTGKGKRVDRDLSAGPARGMLEPVGARSRKGERGVLEGASWGCQGLHVL